MLPPSISKQNKYRCAYHTHPTTPEIAADSDSICSDPYCIMITGAYQVRQRTALLLDRTFASFNALLPRPVRYTRKGISQVLTATHTPLPASTLIPFHCQAKPDSSTSMKNFFKLFRIGKGESEGGLQRLPPTTSTTSHPTGCEILFMGTDPIIAE
jgi:hypothetical protein